MSDDATMNRMSKGDLSTWTRKQLIERVRMLERQVAESKHKKDAATPGSKKLKTSSKRRKKVQKKFDMSLYRRRHVALLLAYDGQGYSGFAGQTETDNTTEGYLMRALQKTCLITDKDTCSYSRCGRTDKDVSGMGQVVALDIRSRLRKGILFAPENLDAGEMSGVVDICQDESTFFRVVVKSEFLGEAVQATLTLPKHATMSQLLDASDSALGIATEDIEAVVVGSNRDGPRLHEKSPVREQLASDEDRDAAVITLLARDGTERIDELDYVMMLNRVLPENIRVLGWAPVSRTFDARFSCKGRTYRYFFPRRSLNIDRMREAAAQLVGVHDCRNFCKMDVLNVSNFTREIMSCRILETDEHSSSERSILAFEIRGRGFLYHQVRCIVAVLILVGQELEDPDIVSWMQRIDEVDAKPTYAMAPGYPLLFYHCEFEDLKFRRSKNASLSLRRNLETRWCKAAVETAMLRTLMAPVIDETEEIFSIEDARDETPTHDFSEARSGRRVYTSLRERRREKSYGDRIRDLMSREKSSAKRARYERNAELRRLQKQEGSDEPTKTPKNSGRGVA